MLSISRDERQILIAILELPKIFLRLRQENRFRNVMKQKSLENLFA